MTDVPEFQKKKAKIKKQLSDTECKRTSFSCSAAALDFE